MEIVVLSGAGISAESGLKTFRDNNGLWEEYSVYDVATPEAWLRDPALVTRFYNQRRAQLFEALPNKAHFLLADLATRHQVRIVTQNIDDFHERAGSTEVLHLHGELKKLRSTVDEELVYEAKEWEVKMGDLCEKGSQLRPHVVWFGEAVPNMSVAEQWVGEADMLIIIGTSLNVYPAAGLAYAAKPACKLVLIDPADVQHHLRNVRHLKVTAVEGMEKLHEELMK
jgi:NAD-dependent deacetylase